MLLILHFPCRVYLIPEQSLLPKLSQLWQQLYKIIFFYFPFILSVVVVVYIENPSWTYLVVFLLKSFKIKHNNQTLGNIHVTKRNKILR